MSLATSLVAIKTAATTLNTLIGTRFYPDALTQNQTFPAVTFREISRTNADAMGMVNVNNHPRVQMDGYVRSSRSGGTTSIETLRDALIGAFYNYRGVIGGHTIKSIRIANQMRNPAGLEMYDTNTETDRILIDFMVDFE